jgi:acetoin utilization deacetylase AcuC-like enzyme
VLDFDVHHGNGTEEGFKDFNNLFYGSTHEFEAFPGTGIDYSPHVGDRSKNLLHRRIVDRYLYRGPASRDQFQIKWKEVVEEMILFEPNLIIISAGFDAHDEDPLADCELIEEDFQWATDIIMKACIRIDPDMPPPVLSILEGGYDLEAISSSASVHVRSLANGYPPPSKKGDEITALTNYLESIGI